VPPLTFPLVRLVAVQHLRVPTVLGEKQPQRENVAERQPEARLREVLVLLHEEVGAIAEEEVRHDDAHARQRDEQRVRVKLGCVLAVFVERRVRLRRRSAKALNPAAQRHHHGDHAAGMCSGETGWLVSRRNALRFA
jgi:hypothetical protein